MVAPECEQFELGGPWRRLRAWRILVRRPVMRRELASGPGEREKRASHDEDKH